MLSSFDAFVVFGVHGLFGGFYCLTGQEIQFFKSLKGKVQ